MKIISIIKASNDLASGRDNYYNEPNTLKGICDVLNRRDRNFFVLLFKPENQFSSNYWFDKGNEWSMTKKQFAVAQNDRFMALCLLDAYIDSDGYEV